MHGKPQRAGNGRGSTIEGLTERNIDRIMRLEEDALQRRTAVERIAERATSAAGSTPFVVLHIAWFVGWIMVNKGLVPGVEPFDAFPFSFLTFCVSLEAIFLTLLVLMSQKRLMREADKRAHLDLQLNMLAEQESTETLRIVRLICKSLGVREQAELQSEELEKPTNVEQLAEKIEQTLPT